ncbi:deltex 3-like (Drosophila) [Seminavis robusta]|uniref:RING-type E3 ubiquitin transferase n=1 Tax=Seminavis robusta TaxID=568900 RepID=A0A9N8E6P0_9STRA|nr:deltex 3-like (Drosophila) [Seminavis robusta]|eukprot:Sro601_g173610.1 deltex 3-like (Drosophila) (389) ;mRNA; r:47702-48868
MATAAATYATVINPPQPEIIEILSDDEDIIVDLTLDDSDDDDDDMVELDAAFAKLMDKEEQSVRQRQHKQVESDQRLARSLLGKDDYARLLQEQQDANFAKSITLDDNEESRSAHSSQVTVDNDKKLPWPRKKPVKPKPKPTVKPPPKPTITPIGTLHYNVVAIPQTNEDPFHPVPPEELISCKDECPICFEVYSKDVVEMNVCRHRFHKDCIDTMCHLCSVSHEEPNRGRSPSGTMSISVSTGTCCSDCSGHAGVGSIQVTYSINGGVLGPHHQQPGAPFARLSHVTMLPNNTKGRALLKRMEYAFERGLSFDVPSNRPSGALAIYTAACANHVDSLTATLQSWLDPHFIEKCHETLDNLKVPAALVLRHSHNVSFDQPARSVDTGS